MDCRSERPLAEPQEVRVQDLEACRRKIKSAHQRRTRQRLPKEFVTRVEKELLRCVPALHHVMLVGSDRTEKLAALGVLHAIDNGNLASEALLASMNTGSAARTIAEANRCQLYMQNLLHGVGVANT